MVIPASFDWPDWAVDTPCHDSQEIMEGSPICSVLAKADDADSAKQLAQTRVKMLLNLLKEKS
jgi:predicted ATP-grasp superfamily ATP-dependent carboligase